MAKLHKKKMTPKKLKSSLWMNEMLEPVDPEIFSFVSIAYQAAAHLTMPVENPAARPIVEIDGKLLSFSDIPVNRGMLAAKKQLMELNAKNHQAYLCRLMHFGEILGAKDQFGDLIRVGDTPDALMVSDAVIHAAATARIVIAGEHMGYDVDDVVRRAKEYAASHPD